MMHIDPCTSPVGGNFDRLLPPIPLQVPREGVEPSLLIQEQDFKSCVSAVPPPRRTLTFVTINSSCHYSDASHRVCPHSPHVVREFTRSKPHLRIGKSELNVPPPRRTMHHHYFNTNKSSSKKQCLVVMCLEMHKACCCNHPPTWSFSNVANLQKIRLNKLLNGSSVFDKR